MKYRLVFTGLKQYIFGEKDTIRLIWLATQITKA